MAGIDELATTVRERAQAVARKLRSDSPPVIPGFGIGSLLTLAAVGQRDAVRPGDDGLFQQITPQLVDQVLQRVGGARGVPVSREEAARVLELLRSGELERDLASGIESVLMLVTHLPSALIDDALDLPTLPVDLAKAIVKDLEGLPATDPRALLEDLRDGHIDRPPSLLRETAGRLLREAGLRTVVQTLRTLIGRDNETFRLALMVYARSQGFDLTDEDLDALSAALDPDAPRLELLLDRGLVYVRRRSKGAEEALNIIQRLAVQPRSRSAVGG
jgi:hypothetical protein